MSPRLPCALAIGGLDPGGGAGVLADVRSFGKAGVFGCAVVALNTVQSTAGLVEVLAVDAAFVLRAAMEVLRHQRVRAIKVGALGSPDNVRSVVKLARRFPEIPLVVDAPLLPSRGATRLADVGAASALCDHLFPRAALVTLNVAEAAFFARRPVDHLEGAEVCSQGLAAAFRRPVLLKGGHFTGADATDVLAFPDGRTVRFRAARIPRVEAHGTGCTLASLVAGRLALSGALGDSALVASIRWAKRVHHGALQRAVQVGEGMRVLWLR